MRLYLDVTSFALNHRYIYRFIYIYILCPQVPTPRQLHYAAAITTRRTTTKNKKKRMCYQESRWHAFCNHTIVTRVPCPTPTSCAQHLGQVDIDIIETHVTTHCHRCRDKVDNLGVKTPAAKRSAHQKKSSMSEGQQQQQHKKAESEDLSGLNNKRWSPRTPKSAAATTTTTTTTRAPRQLSSSTSMDNLRRPSTTTFSAFLPRTTTAAAAAASKPLRGTPGRVLHPAASMGDLRQRRARSSSDSASVAPSSLSSPRQQHIAAALTGYRSSSLTGRKASTGDVMRPCVDNASYKQWEAADAKPWSMFDLLVSPAPPPKVRNSPPPSAGQKKTTKKPRCRVVLELAHVPMLTRFCIGFLRFSHLSAQ